MPQQHRDVPTEVSLDALDAWMELAEWCNGRSYMEDERIEVDTPEGTETAYCGDRIVKTDNGFHVERRQHAQVS
jgi:hypothetical protein